MAAQDLTLPGPYMGFAEPRERTTLAPMIAVPPSVNTLVRDGLVVPRKGWYAYTSGLSQCGELDAFTRKDAPAIAGRHACDLNWTYTSALAANAIPWVGAVGSANTYLLSPRIGDDAAMGYNREFSTYFITGSSPARPAEFWYLATTIEKTALADHAVEGLLVLNEAGGTNPSRTEWLPAFCIGVRCERRWNIAAPSTGLDYDAFYLFLIYWDHTDQRWEARVEEHVGGTIGVVGAAANVDTYMGTDGTDRSVAFKAEATNDAGSVDLKLWLAGTKVLDLSDTPPPAPAKGNQLTAPGYTRIGVRVRTEAYDPNCAGGTNPNDMAGQYGLDGVGITYGDEATTGRVQALAIMDPPVVEPHGPVWTAGKLLLACVGRHWRVAEMNAATLTWTHLWGYPSAPTRPVVTVPIPQGLVVMDGAHPPYLTNGFWWWQLGMEPLERGFAFQQITTGDIEHEKVYEYALTWYNPETREESQASQIRSPTITTGNHGVYMYRQDGPASPQATHVRVYRRCITDGETVFRRVAERPLDLYAYDGLASDQVPQDVDHELPDDLGMPPYTPVCAAWSGNRMWWVGSEWQELFTEQATASDNQGGSLSIATTAEGYRFMQYVEAGDLVYIDKLASSGRSGWHYAASDPSGGFVYLDKPVEVGGTDTVKATVYKLRPEHRAARWSSLLDLTRNADLNQIQISPAEDLVAVIPMTGQTLFAASNSLWAMVGTDPATWVKESRSATVGLCGPLAWAFTDVGLFLGSQNGVYSFDGLQTSRLPVSAPIQALWDRIPDDQKSRIAMQHDEEHGWLLVAVCDRAVGAADNNTLLILDYNTGQWMPPARIAITCFAATTDATGTQQIYFGTPDGEIGRLWAGHDGVDVRCDAVTSGTSGTVYAANWYGAQRPLGNVRIEAAEHTLEPTVTLSGGEHPMRLGVWFRDGTEAAMSAWPSQMVWAHPVRRRQQTAGQLVDFTPASAAVDETQRVAGFTLRVEAIR